MDIISGLHKFSSGVNTESGRSRNFKAVVIYKLYTEQVRLSLIVILDTLHKIVNKSLPYHNKSVCSIRTKCSFQYSL